VSEVKINVPEGMLNVAMDSAAKNNVSLLTLEQKMYAVLEAALLWQRENAPVPSIDDCIELEPRIGSSELQDFARAWIRRMYDAPELGIPVWTAKDSRLREPPDKLADMINAAITEAFLEGQKAGSK